MLFPVLLFATPTLATGLGAGNPPARIPVPAREFSAAFEDKTGTIVQATSVTFSAEVFLYGTVGAGQVTIPFEKLTNVRFSPASIEDKLTATATMKDGETLSILVDDDLVVYGATTFGNYSIRTADLRSITFP